MILIGQLRDGDSDVHARLEFDSVQWYRNAAKRDRRASARDHKGWLVVQVVFDLADGNANKLGVGGRIDPVKNGVRLKGQCSGFRGRLSDLDITYSERTEG